MRMLTRVALFFLTLFLGLQAVMLANYLAEEFSLPADADIEVDGQYKDPAQAELPEGIRISYNGMFPRIGDETPTLRFLVYNGSSRELSCIGYWGICASPEIRVHGLDAKAWVCMNGSSNYTIKPGRSAELMVSAADFQLLPGKGENVAIGYEFDNLSGAADQHFAEPIILPAEFRMAVRKYLKEISEY